MPENAPNLLPRPVNEPLPILVKCFQTGIQGQYDSLSFSEYGNPDSWLVMQDAPHLSQWR